MAGGGTAASTPSMISASISVPVPFIGGNFRGGAFGTFHRPAALLLTDGAARRHVDDYDMGSVQGDDHAQADGATTPMESEGRAQSTMPAISSIMFADPSHFC